jgi:hypothetical protein
MLLDLLADFMEWRNKGARRERELLENGVRGRARVVKMKKSHLSEGHAGASTPRVKLVLDVEDGQATYRVEKKLFLAESLHDRVREGAVIEVAIDPRDRTEVAIVFT